MHISFPPLSSNTLHNHTEGQTVTVAWVSKRKQFPNGKPSFLFKEHAATYTLSNFMAVCYAGISYVLIRIPLYLSCIIFHRVNVNLEYSYRKKQTKPKAFSKLRAFPVAGQVAEQLEQDAWTLKCSKSYQPKVLRTETYKKKERK